MDPPPADPQPQPPVPVKPVPVKPATIAVARGARSVDGKRRATLATLRCPRAASCRITAPRRVKVRIAGKRYTLVVLAPRTIAAGKRATIRVRLSKAAARRLQGRRAVVRLRVTMATQGKPTTRTIRVTLEGRKASGRSGGPG